MYLHLHNCPYVASPEFLSNQKRPANLRSILPTPPRYPSQPNNAYVSSGKGGMAAPLIESSNTISQPTGPEFQLAVGEGIRSSHDQPHTVAFINDAIGTYILRDSIHLATPPPHPHETSSANPNPLASTLTSVTSGVKLSLCTVTPRKASPHVYNVGTGSVRSSNESYDVKESDTESGDSRDVLRNGASSHGLASTLSGKPPAFGGDNMLLTTVAGKEGTKRRKPKTSLLKSSSTYISRVMTNENLNKRIQEHSSEGLFAFANVNRAFNWLDMSSPPTSKVIFCCERIAFGANY